jgi:hypothetical protein
LQEQALDQQQRQCHALKHRVKALEKYKARVAQHSQRVCQRKARELEEKQQLLDRIQQKVIVLFGILHMAFWVAFPGVVFVV